MNPEFVAAMREVQAAAHANSRSKGFYDDLEIIDHAALTASEYMRLRLNATLARLGMIGSEVGEAVDAFRDSYGNMLAFKIPGPFGRELKGTVQGSELADIVIRVMDLAEFTGIDLGAEIEAKMAKNAAREHRHGKLA